MKSVFAIALAVLATLAAALFSEGPAGATPSSSVTIELLRYPRTSGNGPAGWTANGAFSDAGSWADIGGEHFEALPSPVTGSLQEQTMQVGSAGTLQMRWQAQFSQYSEQDLCEIVGGTGTYTGLHGTGRWTFYRDASGFAHITCTAMVHFD